MPFADSATPTTPNLHPKTRASLEQARASVWPGSRRATLPPPTLLCPALPAILSPSPRALPSPLPWHPNPLCLDPLSLSPFAVTHLRTPGPSTAAVVAPLTHMGHIARCLASGVCSGQHHASSNPSQPWRRSCSAGSARPSRCAMLMTGERGKDMDPDRLSVSKAHSSRQGIRPCRWPTHQ